MFASPVNKTPLTYLTEELDSIRQSKTWGDDPLRLQIRGPRVEDLLKEYTRQKPHDETGEMTRIPVFYVELPTFPQPRGTNFLPSAFLEQLSDPAAHVRASAYTKTDRLIKLIRACRVELIILSQFHHLLSPQRKQPLKEFNWVLELIMHQIKEVPVVVSGDAEMVSRLLGREFSLARRFFSLSIPAGQQETATQERIAQLEE